MTVTKTWIVNSGRNARTTHQAMDGETVKINETFSNGMMFPGDSGDPAEVANCNCTIAIEGQSRARYRNPSTDGQLRTFDIIPGRPMAESTSNPVKWGELIDPDGDFVDDIVIKAARTSERNNEILAQQINDYYGFQVPMPRIVTRQLLSEGPGERLIMPKVPGKPVVDDVWELVDQDIDPLEEAKDIILANSSEEERHAIALYDAVIGNTDRHYGNLMIADDGGLVAIDHGLTFSSETMAEIRASIDGSILPETLADDLITVADRKILQSLIDDVDRIRAEWGTKIGNDRIDAMLARVQKMLDDGTMGYFDDRVVVQQIDDAVAPWANPELDDVIQNSEIEFGERVAESSSNEVRWGFLEDGTEVVIKDSRDSIGNELFAQYMNDTYELGVNMPRVVVIEDAGQPLLVYPRVEGSTVSEYTMVNDIDKYAFLEDVASAEDIRSMGFFDAILGNGDRHMGNVLVASDDSLVAIDHGLILLDDGSSAISHAAGFEGRQLTSSQELVLTRILEDEDEIRAAYTGFREAYSRLLGSSRLDIEEKMDLLIDNVTRILEQGHW